MGKNSKIEWTDHTFNPWWGCTKVSEACKHCYAEAWSKRVGQKVWGPKAERRFFTERHWSEPIRWNNNAALQGRRLRVFCASMADIYEDRRDLDEWRLRLWTLIEATPQLDWLLLTKRPELAAELTNWRDGWPSNVWLGTTVEDQKSADLRLPCLASIPAAVRFISAEPLLSALDVQPHLGNTINWVITGGESGSKARPSSPSWFRGLLSQCIKASVPFHFKQWGDWAPSEKCELGRTGTIVTQKADDGTMMLRMGKRSAGRLLDGTMWDGLPGMRAA